MDAENLRDLVKRYEDNRQFITNEETAKDSIEPESLKIMNSGGQTETDTTEIGAG